MSLFLQDIPRKASLSILEIREKTARNEFAIIGFYAFEAVNHQCSNHIRL